MDKTNRRIFIVGSPGSGKTTLASILSKKLQIPHFDLDEIRFPSPKKKRPDEEAVPFVEQLVKKPNWIIEGIYISWIKPFIDKADLIIFLDTPYQVALYRIILRYLQNMISGQTQHGFTSTLILIKNLTMFHFSKNEQKYVTLSQTAKIVSKYSKTKIIKSNEDLQKLILQF